jgi:hypothetical protein
MRIGEFAQLVEAAFKHNKQILAVGPAGIGKTQVPEDFCRDHGWDFGALCMPMIDPPFLMGYPFRDGDRAGHLPFGILQAALNATKPYVLILDEFGGASSSTLKAALRLMQFREVCGKRLPDCVRVIALSNDVGHGADVQGIIEPMKGRFDSIVNVEPNIDDTVTYGLSRQWPVWLLAFLRNNPDSLCDYVPLKSMQVGGSDPRAWERVAMLYRDGFLDSALASELVCGRVGKGHGSKALAFRRLANTLPDIDQILIDPDGAPVPSDRSAQYLVGMTLATRMTGQTFGSAITYLKRLPQMLRAFSVKDAFRAESVLREKGKLAKDHALITTSRDWTAWVTSPDGKEIFAAGGGVS